MSVGLETVVGSRVEFVVPAAPTGKGRPRFTRSGLVFTPRKTEAAELAPLIELRRQRREAAIAGLFSEDDTGQHRIIA